MIEDKVRHKTVGDLITKLREYPLDALVLIEDPDTSWDAPIYVKREDDGTVVLWSEYAEMDGSTNGSLRTKSS